MEKFRKYLVTILAIVVILPTGVSAANDAETIIVLSDDGVTVDGNPVSQNTEDKVYLAKKTEAHEDVPEELKELENSVVTITDGGTYRVSGKMTDAQLLVAAEIDDEVVLILDNADITCRTAPAVMVYSAKETAIPGESGVTVYLEKDSVNTVNGSHTTKTETVDVKNDAALSSMVSLTIDGEGELKVISDNEGIEVKYKHLTINNGTIRIDSCDDPINASEDGVSHITINGGNIYGTSERGAEGDGMDSNGYITINGGTIVSLANPKSANSGLDSDFGTTINGGIVVGAGNMYDPLENTSGQLFMHLQFTELTDNLICITDKDGTPVFAYDFPYNYSYISFSRPELTEGIYYVYIGGKIEGMLENGLYTEITSYNKGEQMHHGGTSEKDEFGRFGGMRPPMGEGMTLPEGMEFSEGMERPDGMKFPEDMERPKRPEVVKFPEGVEPPNDGFGGRRGPGGMESSGDKEAFEFRLTSENRSFTNVSTGEIVEGFIDVPKDAWFYNSVNKVEKKGLIKGKGNKRFAPDDNVTFEEWITILARLAGVDTEGGEPWYLKALTWGLENQIMNTEGCTFVISEPLKREEMAYMMWRYGRFAEMDMTYNSDLTEFADKDEISDYAKEAFAWAVGYGILQGDENGLRPADVFSRAEAAEILDRLCELLD